MAGPERFVGDCPQIETLEAIATGRVSDPALLGHVSTCTRCKTRSRHQESDRLLLAELSAALRVASPDAADSSARPAPPALPVVEGHEIVRELHRGGQGVVFEALQLEPRRKVALKVLLEGVFASAERLRRFEREIDLVATLRHPNLVTVHRSGRTQDGRHCFTMELVEGIPLHEHAARRRAAGWRTQEILELFKRICAAVGYAHQRGVVHRDLKPANVLVDAAGEPRVLDFGVAKPLAAGGPKEVGENEDDAATRTGVFVGTLAYASPEQVRGESDQIDLRTDVYSLGVLLYELLAGEMPYASKGAFSEAVPAILEVEPPPPRGCDDELAAIVQKALAKERDRRYSSATELLGDVERYLRGEPIDAKRGRTGYLLRKAIARHRVAAAAALGVLVVVVVAALVSTYYAHEAIDAADRSQRSARTTQRVNQFLQDMLWNLSPDQAKGRNVTVRELLDEESRRIDTELADEPEALAALHQTIGRTYASLGINDEAERHCALALSMRRRGVGDEDALIDDLIANAWVRRNRGDFAQAEQHLGEALALLDARAIDDPGRRAVILSDTAETRTARGDSQDAEPLLRTALELLRDCGRHKDAATTLIRLGLLLRERGDLAASESRLREGLEILRQGGDLELISVARGLRHLARTLAELGRLDEAVATADEARELFHKILGDDAPFSILALAELAWLRCRRDGYPAAESLHLEARARRPVLEEREEVASASALHELAALAMERGDLAEADVLFQEALARFERLVGHEHSHVATVLQGHSWLLETRGYSAEAATRAREAVAIQRRLCVGGGPKLAAALMNLAWILFDAGRLLEAEPLAREALAMREAALGGEHPDVASNRSALAYLLHCLGQNAEAERLCRAALDVQRRLAAPSPQIATSLFNLSEILAALGRRDESEPLAREALAIRREHLSKDDSDLAMSLDGLGRQLLERGRFEESRDLLEEALAIRRKRFERGHLHLVWSLENVGAWHYFRHDFAAAETLFQEAVDLARDVLGEEHPELGVALGNLASASDGLGDPEAAASLYAESHAILAATRGASYPDTLRMLEQEIKMLGRLGRTEEAAAREAVLRQARGAAPRR